MKALLTLAIVLVGSFSAFAQHGGHNPPPMTMPTDNRVMVMPEQANTFNAGSFEYVFKLMDNKTNADIGESDLLLDQTKKLHFIAYDKALKDFTHVHPEFDGKVWRVKLNLPVSGNYFVWAQGMLTDNTDFSAPAQATITGGQTANAIKSLGDVRKVTNGQTTLELAKTKITAGQFVMLNFTVSRNDGQAVELKPYLGAFAHVIAVPSTGDRILHVHPEAGSTPNTGVLHLTLPKPGAYRLWVQFIEHDELKVMPVSVIVK